ncbi:Fluconazole resistance protein 1 [Exophiala xenobiotica]|nr:Fluconazole resistance protein 1 [Exophiala xenobiotica]KAK5283628.1 Fluconazole resistance protein 1 [Exophiala xenobiotica]KAK5461895.1 Fluconazole resistance protein 1 [Exophiala xenobiotica]
MSFHYAGILRFQTTYQNLSQSQQKGTRFRCAIYVELLESQHAQLASGLQKLYQQTQSGIQWIGAPLKKTSSGLPLTHDILERLGVFKEDDLAPYYHFEEDINALQLKLNASDDVDLMYDQPLNDTCLDNSTSYIHQPVAGNSGSSDSFGADQDPSKSTKPSPTPRAHPNLPTTSHFPQVSYANFDPGRNGVAAECYDSGHSNHHFNASMLSWTTDLPLSYFAVCQGQAASTTLDLCPTMEEWANREDILRFRGRS